jgi:uncharacterized membrane protein
MNAPPPVPEKSSTGLEANLAAALSYLAGFISGIVFLVLEKESRFVRFHAMQSTIFFLPLSIVYVILLGIPILGWVLAFFVWVGGLIAWLLLMFKAYQGERFKLPIVGDLAEQQIR